MAKNMPYSSECSLPFRGEATDSDPRSSVSVKSTQSSSHSHRSQFDLEDGIHLPQNEEHSQITENGQVHALDPSSETLVPSQNGPCESELERTVFQDNHGKLEKVNGLAKNLKSAGDNDYGILLNLLNKNVCDEDMLHIENEDSDSGRGSGSACQCAGHDIDCDNSVMAVCDSIQADEKLSSESDVLCETVHTHQVDVLSQDLQKSSLTEDSCDASDVVNGITYVVYKSEKQMPDIMRLITKDLSEPYSIYTYRYFIHNWPKLCFLAMDDSKCVGAIVCKLDLHKKMVRRGYIAMLAVDSEYRRRQIGSTLVTKAIQAMMRDDCGEVVLETEITNQGALHLYENLGFVRDKRLFRYYLNGVDALRLKLWLR